MVVSGSDDPGTVLALNGNREPFRRVGRYARPNGIHHPGPSGGLFLLADNVKEIELSRGKVAIVDDADFAWLNQWKWSFDKGYARRTEYLNGGKKTFRMHRVIMQAKKGEFIDHINGDKLDNRRLNLRFATTAQNTMNSTLSRRNTSGFKGVFRHKKNWSSQITKDGIKIHLGTFGTRERAHEAYCQKAKELFGEFFNPGTKPLPQPPQADTGGKGVEDE